ncbi:MAG: transposase, partial [Cyclobacteriaceae bacterium]|nr:transposase [Cyclobacteriaceae bacterium]
MEKYRNKYRNDSTRLKNRDYGAPGSYFVTLVTLNRKNYFGKIVEMQDFVHPQDPNNVGTQILGSVQLTEIGKIAHQYWIKIPIHFPFVKLDEFVIMPNHVHGLFSFDKPKYPGGKPNAFAPQSRNLASVIRGYKAATKKYATLNNIEFAWQPRYHERVVRLDELIATRRYIKNNPTKWILDHDMVCKDARSCVPTGIKDVPIGIKDVPIGIKDAPTDIKDVPTDIKDVPTDIKDVPTDIKDVPTGIKDVPTGIKDVRTDIKNVPTGITNV